ncbi:MAG: ATP-binding protein [Pirellulales bacterium]
MPSLFVIRGRNQGARFELTEELSSLGRDGSSDLQVNDTEVSRRHAQLRRDGGHYLLSDLGSSNGTYLNGRRIEDEQPLASGDQVQIGGTLMLYTGPSQPAAGLTEQIDIVGQHDASRIVRTLSDEEPTRPPESAGPDAEAAFLAQARSNLQIMVRTSLAVSHTLDIDQLLQRILQLIFEWVEADRGCIMLFDPETRRLAPKARRNRRGRSDRRKMTISQTILDYVVERGEGVLTSDARQDQRWDAGQSIVQAGVREAICVPMRGRYDVVGVIYIDTLTPAERVLAEGHVDKFNEEHLKLMIAIAHQAALAVEDTTYYSAMVQAERMAAIGQTIATLSHHVKNILQGVRGASYLIEEGLKQHNEEVVRKGWKMVERNQEKIYNLVMDMLSFSKEREPDLAPASLNEVVADVVELMQQRALEAKVELVEQLDPSLPTATFDAEGLHRAVLNIVTNAIDACEGIEGASVSVSTGYDAERGRLLAIVADNGTGIAADDLDKLFTMFFSRKGGRGTGLGLAVSHKIVREHGGEIRVTSQPGAGSRFVLEIPAGLSPSTPALSQTISLAGPPEPPAETF